MSFHALARFVRGVRPRRLADNVGSGPGWITFCGMLGVLAMGLCGIHADIARKEDPGQRSLQEFLHQDMPQALAETPERLMDLIEGYDLNDMAMAAIQKIYASSEFGAYLRGRAEPLTDRQFKTNSTLAQGLIVAEYAQTRDDISPEVKAWLCLYIPGFGWDRALAACRQLGQKRPEEYLPKAMLLAQAQQIGFETLTVAQWQDWLEVLRQTLPLAANTGQRCYCLLNAANGALRLRPTENGKAAPARIWEWVREAPLPDLSLNHRDTKRFNTLKYLVAFAAGENVAAAELAGQSSYRCWQPLFLIFANQCDAAVKVLEKLRSDPTLEERERAALRKSEPLILMFGRQYEAARKAIAEQRQAPGLTAKEATWLKQLEDLVGTYEAEVRAREKARTE
jgi:hypothetical protein